MSLAQLKEQLVLLNDAEQRELITFLISRRLDQDEALREEMTRKIDDNDPAHWVDGSELHKLLELGD